MYENTIKRVAILPKNKSFFLLGPRQTGKSTLITRRFTDPWPQKVWKVDLLRYELYLKYSKNPELFRKEALNKIQNEGIRTVFIDEVQRLPALLNEVHSLLNELEAQFILTGSSARKLKRGGANLLAGRALQRFLHPLVYPEWSGGNQNKPSLETLLRFGSLPPLWGRNEFECQDILSAYTQTYLKEEIQAEGLVRQLGGFSRFLDLVAAQCGELINFSNLSREVQLSARTMQSYYQILEDTLVGFRLEPWHKSVRKRLSRHPKFYLFDTGVTNALLQRLTAPPDPVLRGRLFEQFLVLETYRYLSYQQSEARMFYWRTHTGAEVDLLLEKHGQLRAAIEIKSKISLGSRDFSGLRSFRQENSQVPCYVIADVQEPYQSQGIQILPWQHYLAKLWEGGFIK